MASSASEASEPEDDAEVSDFEVDDDEADIPLQPGRRRTGKGKPMGAAGSGSSGAPRGGSRRTRGGLSPGNSGADGPRARRKPGQYSAEQQAELDKRREARRRKRELAAAVAEAAFDRSAEVSIRALASSIPRGLVSRCCHADVTPLPPRTKTGGGEPLILVFECSDCGDVIHISTGESARINLRQDDQLAGEDARSDDDEADDGELGSSRKKRKKTNARPVAVLREVVACLLTGQYYSDYKRACVVRRVAYIHHSTFDRYLGLIWPWIEKLQNDAIDLVRYYIVRYGHYNNLILTHDQFWQTRGHYSENGSGTMCDLMSGGIVASRHYSIGTDSMSNLGGFDKTSKAMDPYGCGEMLNEIVEWVENNVDIIREKYPEDCEDDPKLDSVVLDGDASTNKLIPVVLAAANEKKKTKYCSQLVVRGCCNHIGKNSGNKAKEVGHRVHKSCSCPDRLTQAGTINKTQPKQHVGCNNETDPLIKAYQRGTSAAIRGAVTWKKQKPEEYSNSTLASLTIQGIEEMVNHLSNIHDGPGFVTGERRVCRLHPQQTEDGKPYKAGTYNDCFDFNAEMQQYLKANVIDEVSTLVHPELGGVCQNASERVGDVALKYRAKETPLKPTHYACSTGLAMLHVQSVVIHRLIMELEQEGMTDARLSAWGSMEERLHHLLGLEISVEQRELWLAAVKERAKRSLLRRTIEYKRKRKRGRAQTTQRRSKLKSSHAYQYKGSTGGKAKAAAPRAGNGVAGSCSCTGQCVRNCPCKEAGVGCTPSCHPKHSCKNAACSGLVVAQQPRQPAVRPTQRSATQPAQPREEPRPTRAQPRHSSTAFEDGEIGMPGLDATLVGKEIMFNFNDDGWFCGVVEEENTDPNELDEGRVANFIVYYEADDEYQAHWLSQETYTIRRDAGPGSWYKVKDA